MGGIVMIYSQKSTLQIKRVACRGIGGEAHVLKAQSCMRNQRLYQCPPHVVPS
ncbi:hypothetical protein ALO42_101612 [Pseudomonas syringae pv. atrofaciens]|uniref:Uncharacterized protein n=1 Tax=Pseudomonas syringae pv. lapsa TaxID=199201 RepID=A0AB74A8V7_PSESX|nr:hypothetical protein ALO42_101612 [Pseudomonas syringae pv. atrofaciens]KPX60100.1 hypothetical protein ALO39_101259 [Pseudomonas syringae pv. lapsa]RML18300.1 hypothetical protein ALQ99_101150 [Pseudomonas syringae pv. lapsa]RML27364.1 hypothetical protein ALQ98_100981 [Pseudomonas syringae pv. lapsa]RML35015.1 hypothetical protein ALQ96_101237 [Pseudomonas syringae pv. atrofaciens]